MSNDKPFVILPVPPGMRVQYLVNPQKEVYARAEILGGPGSGKSAATRLRACW